MRAYYISNLIGHFSTSCTPLVLPCTSFCLYEYLPPTYACILCMAGRMPFAHADWQDRLARPVSSAKLYRSLGSTTRTSVVYGIASQVFRSTYVQRRFLAFTRRCKYRVVELTILYIPDSYFVFIHALAAGSSRGCRGTRKWGRLCHVLVFLYNTARSVLHTK